MEEGLKGLLIGASMLAFLTSMTILNGIIRNCMQTQEIAGAERCEQKNIVLMIPEEGK